MPSAEFFRKLGFYTVRNFLDRDFCAEVCQEMQNATPIKGTIGVKNEEAVNENFKRRVEMEDVSSEITDKLREKLRMAIPDLEEFYSVRLFDVQPPKFIEYRPGDFYKPHVSRIARGFRICQLWVSPRRRMRSACNVSSRCFA